MAATGILRDIVLGDPQRLDNCEIACRACGSITRSISSRRKRSSLLVKLAQQQKLEDARDACSAARKSTSPKTARRCIRRCGRKGNKPVMVDGRDVMPEIRAVRRRMAQFAKDVREGRWKGATGKPIRHIVNIGIGGSDLGPRLAVRALAPFAKGPKVHFVANADAFELLSVIEPLDPAETLFVIVSKTFTTQETLLNAQTARRWLADKLGETAIAKHFVAVSVNRGEVEKFGISADNMFPIWDWVGGRFSLWSAVGLSIMLAIGPEHFEKMCDGAAAMDQHFLTQPFTQNMPVLLALLGIWNRDFLGCTSQVILPYSERLRDLPRYLQQLEMESNGKSVTRDGKPTGCATAPVIFGECGTVGQHSFHQWLHQGIDRVPADFIGIATDDLNEPAHHQALLANMVAQAGALAFGKPQAPSPHDIYPGGRPSNLILLDRLDPYHFGLLIALYEHKTFTEGVIWNLNSFDQPGVELGKQMAKGLEAGKPAVDKTGLSWPGFLRNQRFRSKNRYKSSCL